VLRHLRNTQIFLGFQALFILAGFLLVAATAHHALHLKITAIGTPLLDPFFVWITYLGDGLVLGIPCLIILLFVNRKAGAQLIFAYLISGLITQLLKHQFFPDEMRPYAELGAMPEFRFVEGVSHNIANSFPSGHSTSAFAIFYSMALILKGKKWQFIAILTALFTAFSRVYLSQHYLRDALVGSIIGTLFALLVWMMIERVRYLNTNKPLIAWK